MTPALRMFLYHLRMAWRSLRRDRGIAISSFVCLALATSVWTVSVVHYLRIYGPRDPASAALHNVELFHPIAGDIGKRGAFGARMIPRTRISYPEYQAISGSGIPSRETATVRGRVVVRTADAAAFMANARFVNADFFGLFARPFRWGAAWSSGQDTQPVVVLGRPLAARLFPGLDPTGRTLWVDGRPHRVVGAMARHQPYVAEWDLGMMALDQDGLYLPFASFRTLVARPEYALAQSPVGPSFEELLASDTLMLSFWVELPTVALRDAYQRWLAGRLGQRPFTLRTLAAWRRDLELPNTPVRFFALLTSLVLVGGGFNLTRLFLAKGFARSEELGIHRALGAPRRALFFRQILEAAILCLPAAVVGVIASLPYFALWNAIVNESDVPFVLTTLSAAAAAGPGFAVGVAAAVYPAWRLSGVRPTISAGRR